MTSPSQYGQQTPPQSSDAPVATTPDARPRSSGRLLTVGLAAFAVLLGIASVGLSWQASSKAGEALEKISALSTAQPVRPAAEPTVPAATETTSAAGEATPSASATSSAGSDPELSKETQFGVKYENEALRLPLSCNNGINIDVDEPRVGAESPISDVRFYDPCGSGTPYVNLSAGVRGSVTESDSLQPAECVDLIRRSPLSTDNQPIRQGQVYCINTSKDAAKSSAESWKMVIMTISAISQDGTVTIEASAWTIPL
jgi:hypothetical protein